MASSDIQTLVIGWEARMEEDVLSRHHLVGAFGALRLTHAADLVEGFTMLRKNAYDVILVAESMLDVRPASLGYPLGPAVDLPVLAIAAEEVSLSRVRELLGTGIQDILLEADLPELDLSRLVRFAMARHQLLAEARLDASPEAPAPPPAQAVRDATLGKYRLLRLIGEGRSSVVFMAEPLDAPGQRVAIKRLRMPPTMSAAEQTEWTERFQQEMALAPKLVHPHIIRVLEGGVSEESGEPYLVMEYVDGRPLDRSQEILGSLGWTERVRLVKQMAEALGEIHRHGIVHCDLKPANILVTADAWVRIGDFGMAASLPHLGDDHQDRGGTPAYMAPEVYQGGQADARSDIFSLGVVVYEWMLGQRPFTANLIDRLADQVQHDHPLEPRKIDPSFPVPLQRVLAAMLMKQPEDRYQTIDELIQDLDSFLADVSAEVRRRGDPSWWRRTWA